MPDAAWIRRTAEEGDWDELAAQARPDDVARALDFPTALRAALACADNPWKVQSISRYAVGLLESLRRAHPHAWQSDVRHELALATVADKTFAFDERNAALRRALQAQRPPLPEVVWQVAETLYAPEQAPVSEPEAQAMLEDALARQPFAAAAARLAWLYERSGQPAQAREWRRQEALLRKAGEVEPDLRPLLAR